MNSLATKKIVILASGTGTNAENIIRYFNENRTIIIDSVWSNRPNAMALKRAANHGIETGCFTQADFSQSDKFLKTLQHRKIDLIVLAGFLWLIPPHLVKAFPIINIHPALLPAYGGKGMYGNRIHEAVLGNNDATTGITIHEVNEEYDKGTILLQVKCPVKPGDTAETLANRIHKLEYKHYPKVIEDYLCRDELTD